MVARYPSSCTCGLIVAHNGGAGALNINDGAVVVSGTGGITLGDATGSSGTINLNAGGLLQTSQRITRGMGSGYVYFNGGTLMALATSPTFMQGLTAAYVQNSGGAIIDSNGCAITIGQSLLAGGSGGLTVNSSAPGGMLTLSRQQHL